LQASSLQRNRVRVWLAVTSIEGGARAEHDASRQRWAWAPRPLRLRPGRALSADYVASGCGGWAARAQWQVLGAF